MKGVFFIVLIILFFFGFIYFGYYQDYKRNPKEFLRTIIGMPIGFLASILGIESLNQKIKYWVNGDKKIK